jgi:serine protease Do
MQCPSCGHKQTKHLECERCGIIFEKYRKRQERLAAEKTALQEQSELKSRNGIPGMVFGIVIGLLVGGGAFFFFSNNTEDAETPVNSTTIQPQNNRNVSKSQPKAANRKNRTRTPSRQTDEALEGLAQQLAEAHPVDNAIERARNATVFIKTPWGSGSGFFVSRNGMIITNRHVLQMQDKDIQTLNQQVNKEEKLLAREEKTLRYLKGRVPQVRDREMQQQLKEQIQERQQEYARYKDLHTQLLERISEIESASPTNDAEVILIDGSSYSVDSVMMSDRYDLALISINAYESPFIAVSKTPRDQGQKVYTVGNPQGLRHTVTAGVISGYRKFNDTPLIQTDAPINPGNSGGPLIDEQGNVIGVNTMIIRDTEGIGFAIPMKSVFEEFGTYFSQE